MSETETTRKSENETDGADTGPRRTWRSRLSGVRLVALVTVVVLVVTAAVVFHVVADPTEEQLREQAGLIGKAELLIGVKDDIPGVSQRDGEVFTGFDIEIAYLIGADLGFSADEVRFLTIQDEDRGRMNANDPLNDNDTQVDLVIATYSITEERAKDPNVNFSAPYLITEQSVITRKDHPDVHDLTDLAGRTVCTLSTSTSESPAGAAGAVVKHLGRISDCVDGLREGRFDAVTSDAPLLAGFVAAEPDVFRHHDIGLAASEQWGVNAGKNEALLTLVNLALYRSWHDPDDRRWEQAYLRHLRPLEDVNKPQPLVIGGQPEVPEPAVRRYPWE